MVVVTLIIVSLGWVRIHILSSMGKPCSVGRVKFLSGLLPVIGLWLRIYEPKAYFLRIRVSSYTRPLLYLLPIY